MSMNQMRMMFIGSGFMLFGLVAQGHLSWVAHLKDSSALEQAKAETLRVQESDIQVAEARFKAGCTYIGIPGNIPVQISEGMAVYGHSAEGMKKNSLADGTVICDEWGGTAVMQNGAAVQFASSPNYLKANP